MANGYIHPHFHLRLKGKREPYKSPKKVVPPSPPQRERLQHAADLQSQYSDAISALIEKYPDAEGFYVKFTVPPSHAHIVDDLESQKKQIEVLSAKELNNGATVATVFVPEEQRNFFPTKFEAYKNKDTKTGRPKNKNLIARIEKIEAAQLQDLFVGTALPENSENINWELWIRKERFQHFANAGFELDENNSLVFPERIVTLLTATRAELEELLARTDVVAEVRVNSVPAPFIIDVPNNIQGATAADLRQRTTFANGDSPIICLLDTGVNRGHPLLEGAVSQQHAEAFNSAWGGNDIEGHGTGMAGLCLYGDITGLLNQNQQVNIGHRLQSMKILGPIPNAPQLYGSITTDSITKSDISAPTQRKLICMAVTSEGQTDGKPSSWSAAIDQLCFGSQDSRRLFIVSAGNFRQTLSPLNYPAENDSASIEDPAQAWNTLSVGACTQKIALTPENAAFSLMAPNGGLSPRSRTSLAWSRQWPIRPDVVLEGGNFVHDGNAGLEAPELKLVTTNHAISDAHFRTFGDTSGASALAAELCAKLMIKYPNYWPETIRALIVHSAEWTDAMKSQSGGAMTKASKNVLLRRFGYGLPDFDRAAGSANNDANLVLEDSFQPFRMEGGAGKSNEMVVHALPWPRAELQGAGEILVRIKITLSYFIEPNPGKAWSRKHAYQSHALRFAFKRSTETLGAFRSRVNAAIESEESGAGAGDNWFLGSLRNSGSLHSDTWEGTAAELAEMDSFGIYPIGGWWKNNSRLGKALSQAPYAAIVSLKAPVELNVYTPIDTLIKQVIEI